MDFKDTLEFLPPKDHVVNPRPSYGLRFTFSGGSVAFRADWVKTRLSRVNDRLAAEIALLREKLTQHCSVAGHTLHDSTGAALFGDLSTKIGEYRNVNQALAFVNQAPGATLIPISLAEYEMLGELEASKRALDEVVIELLKGVNVGVCSLYEALPSTIEESLGLANERVTAKVSPLRPTHLTVLPSEPPVDPT